MEYSRLNNLFVLYFYKVTYIFITVFNDVTPVKSQIVSVLDQSDSIHYTHIIIIYNDIILYVVNTIK